jgi:hypothetical protein
MSKISEEETIIIKNSELVTLAIEAMIDARFNYLREKEYENHTIANKIIKEEYEPALKVLKKILEKTT